MMDFLMILKSMGFLGFGLTLVGGGGIMAWLGHGRHFKIGAAEIILGTIVIIAILFLFNCTAFWNYIVTLIVALIGLAVGASMMGAAFFITRSIAKKSG